jgi:hypothetical protein
MKDPTLTPKTLVDPLSLLLPNDVYVVLNAPRPPELARALKGMSKEKLTETIDRARMLRTYADAVLAAAPETTAKAAE